MHGDKWTSCEFFYVDVTGDSEKATIIALFLIDKCSEKPLLIVKTKARAQQICKQLREFKLATEVVGYEDSKSPTGAQCLVTGSDGHPLPSETGHAFPCLILVDMPQDAQQFRRWVKNSYCKRTVCFLVSAPEDQNKHENSVLDDLETDHKVQVTQYPQRPPGADTLKQQWQNAQQQQQAHQRLAQQVAQQPQTAPPVQLGATPPPPQPPTGPATAAALAQQAAHQHLSLAAGAHANLAPHMAQHHHVHQATHLHQHQPHMAAHRAPLVIPPTITAHKGLPASLQPKGEQIQRELYAAMIAEHNGQKPDVKGVFDHFVEFLSQTTSVISDLKQQVNLHSQMSSHLQHLQTELLRTGPPAANNPQAPPGNPNASGPIPLPTSSTRLDARATPFQPGGGQQQSQAQPPKQPKGFTPIETRQAVIAPLFIPPQPDAPKDSENAEKVKKDGENDEKGATETVTSTSTEGGSTEETVQQPKEVKDDTHGGSVSAADKPTTSGESNNEKTTDDESKGEA